MKTYGIELRPDPKCSFQVYKGFEATYSTREDARKFASWALKETGVNAVRVVEVDQAGDIADVRP